MSKPNITLPRSKAVVAESASRIYAAYVSTGAVKKEDAEKWIKRSIREAIAISRTVDSAVQCNEELPTDRPVVVEPGAELSSEDSSGSSSNESGPSASAESDVVDEVLLSGDSDSSGDGTRSETGTSQAKGG